VSYVEWGKLGQLKMWGVRDGFLGHNGHITMGRYGSRYMNG